MARLLFYKGKEVTWLNMRINIDGVPVTKITGIKYKVGSEKILLFAEGGKPVAIQRGNDDNEGSLTLLKGGVDDLNRAAKAAGGDDLRDLVVDIVVEYKAVGTTAIQIDTLVNVEFKSYEKGWEQGATSMKIEMPFLFLELISI